MKIIEAEQIAQEIIGWTESAYYDVACGQVAMKSNTLTMNQAGHSEAEGIADRMTGDVDAICDLLGDKIHDKGKGQYP